MTNYSDVFNEGYLEVKLSLKQSNTSVFCKARQVPYALRVAVNKEIQRLESLGVIESVAHSDWVTPLVAVPKSDGSVCL